ncbi:glutathione S-transferase family protein [Halobellus limi]|uniref:Glutathione S-transferase family protein n=1 Tax=Halobellus limi TaxID=699433 RepID=A0A1H5YJP9_9EURY|nr:glutathione S-transferase family protein [Halobellus limi]QCC48440.1 glutathione S-transferase family protein [Halobellus limi]SEG23825.1 putative glutathione S-transferase [Halobellus limi]
MNMLVDGEWRTDAYQTTNEEGEFDRQETSFRDRIQDDPDAEFPAESGRYHVYISRACPWAHRVAMTRRLKGLEDDISLSIVEPVRYDDGWEFSEEYPDPLYGEEFLRDVYVRADPDFTGRVTVPVLWDREKETIVNNESREIMRMLDTEFEGPNGVDLWPEGHREAVDQAIDDIYDPINNGVYRAGFADTQEAYENAVEDVFAALDHWEEVLDDQRYLVGDVLTEADVAMFATLVRFDHVYHTHFKCNRRAIHEYPNLWNYTKDIYQTPGVAETVNVDHITRHYYMSHGDVNPKRLVPTGPDIDFSAPHDRDRLAADLPPALRGDAAPADD